MKIAYLVNQYPKLSHTFIRREILALELQGVEVVRFSIRRNREELPAAVDRDEALRTTVLLDLTHWQMIRRVFQCLIANPMRWWIALWIAWQAGRDSDRGRLRNLAYFVEACALRMAVAEHACDHVHAHFGTNSTDVAMLNGVLGGPAFSFTVHGPEEFDRAERLHLRQKIARACFVVAISEFGRSQLYRRARFGDWGKIHVVRCGVDPALWALDRDIPQEGRLVCVGRLCEQKGQLILIEAAARLLALRQPFSLALVGDGELRSCLERSLEMHDLGDHVHITGWASDDVVREYVRGARALVLPSFAEGLPVVIMEAFALGRPVVSTYIAGIPELVEPGRSGWLVPAGSVDHLVHALQCVLNESRTELQRLGAHGRKRVLAQHDIHRSATELAGLFASAIPA